MKFALRTIALIGLVATATACSSASTGASELAVPGPSLSGLPEFPEPGVGNPVTDGSLERLYARVYGGTEESFTTEVMMHVALSQGMRQCLAELGVDYPESVFRSVSTQGKANPVAVTYTAFSTLGDPQTQLPSERAHAEWERARAAIASEGELDPGLDTSDTYWECDMQVGERATEIENTGGAEAAALRLALDDLLVSVSAQPQVQTLVDQYPVCMEGAGYPAASTDDLWWGLLSEAGISPDEVEVDSDRWSMVVSEEAQALSADAQCRSELRSVAAEALKAPLAAFESEHAADLERLDQAWAALRQDAEAAMPTLQQ